LYIGFVKFLYISKTS